MYTMFRYTLMYIMYSETYVIHHEYKEAGARRPGRTVYTYIYIYIYMRSCSNGGSLISKQTWDPLVLNHTYIIQIFKN